MKKFSIAYDVNSASGTVVFTVEAETREQAIALFENGEGEITHEEIEPSYVPVDFNKEVYEGE